ncbi:MAG: tetratricopeptide repeat protein [Candidatus Rifleibacteriota bacterium]
MKKLYLTLILCCVVVSLSAHPAFNNKKARKYLQAGKLEAAEKELHLARFAEPQRAEIKYNLGYLSYRKRNYKKAIQYFSDAAQNTDDKELRFSSLHNLGNASYRQGNYAKAVEAYKKGLEIEQNAETSYNLKKAEEMLKKQIEQQQKEQQNKEQKKQKQQKSGEQQQNKQQQGNNKQQNQGQKDQGQQNKDSQQNKGSQQKNGQQKPESDKKQSGSNERQKADKSEKGQQKQQQSGEKSEQQKQNQQKQNQQGQSDKGEQQERGEGNNQERQDVQMGDKKGDDKKMPQASQRARALKNRKLNPYMVEKLLRDLKEREKKGQLYYRNEPRRQEETDPFSMNARQLRDFFRNRGRRGRSKPGTDDEPDW